MKKLTALILVFCCVVALCSCGGEPSHDDTAVYFEAKVTEVGEGHLMAEITDQGSTSLAPDTPVHVSTNFEGYTVCETGDTIRVTFDGMIQELYSPIIPNVTTIEKIG